MDTTSGMEAVREVAQIVKAAGGRALLVGGCVRDSILGGDPKDFDVECFGIAPADLKAALAKKFDLDLVGASFGVIKLAHLDVDVAIPRRETKLGLGHRAFEMEYDPTLTVRDASARRDFTVNAIYRDPLTGEIVDPWNGRADLEKRILRHVSDHFCEDPLRVLRGMQFVARFDLDPAPETIEVCRAMTPEGLASERLFGEWSKLILKGVKISKGLNFLRDVGWVKYYPELERLIGCKQDPKWHPEGDVWNHTLCCLDAFAASRIGDDAEDLLVGLAVLCHDFGKPDCTFYDPVKKRIRSLGHDERGVESTLSFLRRLTNEERLLKEVPPLVRLHMRPYAMWHDKSSDGAIRRLAAKVIRIDRLLRVAAADDAGRPPFPSEPEPLKWLAEQAKRLEVEDSAPKPIVRGRDLIAQGMKPGPAMGRVLAELYEAQLDGRFSDLESGLRYLGKKFKPAIASLLLLMGVASSAATLEVGPGRAYALPSEAARAARDGDVVEISAGRYAGDVCAWRANDLVIRGAGRDATVVDAAGKICMGKGIWVVCGTNTVIEGVSFAGAKCKDRNGAGIRLDADGNLTVRQCAFRGNENGILSGALDRSEITIDGCVFSHNGAGDGFSHNVYIGAVKRLEFSNCVSDHAVRGHCLKSRARATVVADSVFDDGDDGVSSYLVDCPDGGKVVIRNCRFVQSPKASNGVMVSVGEESVRPHSTYLGFGNTFENRRAPRGSDAEERLAPGVVVLRPGASERGMEEGD